LAIAALLPPVWRAGGFGPAGAFGSFILERVAGGVSARVKKITVWNSCRIGARADI